MHEPGCCRAGIQTHTAVSLAVGRSGPSAVSAPFYLKPGAQHPLAELKLSKDLGQPGPLLQDGLVYASLGLFPSHVRMRMARRKGPLLLFTC